MTLKIKHKAFGKWTVLDGATIVAENLTKRQAQEMAGLPVDPEPEPKPEVVGEERGAIPFQRDGKNLTEIERRREYERRLEADSRAEGSDIVQATRALWLLKFDPTTVDALMRTVEPALRAGPDGLRREIRRNQRVAAA